LVYLDGYVAVFWLAGTIKKMNEPNDKLEREILSKGYLRIAGIDECGRGSAAGPASVGVVVVDLKTLNTLPPAGIKDSKLLSPKQRKGLTKPIKDWVTEYAVGHSYPDEIDRIGINKALRSAARRALAELDKVDVVILDGKFNWLASDQTNIIVNGVDINNHQRNNCEIDTIMKIGADLSCISVAAASILAKVSHDSHMVELEEMYPGYGWTQHNGYLTEYHKNAIKVKGLSPAHRRTWKIIE